jgi:hypothetical protein
MTRVIGLLLAVLGLVSGIRLATGQSGRRSPTPAPVTAPVRIGRGAGSDLPEADLLRTACW